jgi:pimeloyl-ACP methyl ester carboxylesterase
MNIVTSQDGTKIAYDRQGQGPALIFVDGALCARGAKADLAALLAPHFTVYTYDRRGRGDSGDTLPYAAEREIEDIAALIGEAGGSASLYGHSSGAALALRAAIALGTAVPKLALYEAPYNDDPAAQQAWRTYLARLSEMLAADRRGDAVALFMALVGMPAEQIDGARQSPFWPAMEAIAPTLAYDHAGVMGGDGSVPTELAARASGPALVMYGTAGAPFMRETARTLSQAIGGAQLRAVEGQGHDVDPAVLAPVLREFLGA